METSIEIQSSINELAKDLFREDEIGAVIRAHIRLESILIKLVESLITSPKHLNRLNLDYDSYVNLALALGLDEDLGPVLHAMGKLRNNFAHKLDTKLDSGVVNNLYQALSNREKQQLQTSFSQMRNENEDLKKVSKISELSPGDQFKIIAVIIWAAMQAAQFLMFQQKYPKN